MSSLNIKRCGEMKSIKGTITEYPTQKKKVCAQLVYKYGLWRVQKVAELNLPINEKKNNAKDN